MNNKLIFLMTYFFCVCAIDPEYEAEFALAQKSACFFITHTKSGCVLGRPNKQAKQLTHCDHDESLKKQLEDGRTSMTCLYDEDRNMIGYPAVVFDWSSIDGKAFYASMFAILLARPKAIYGKITLSQGKPVLSFYDKNKLWIRDYQAEQRFFAESKGKIELSRLARKQLSESLDLSKLEKIENEAKEGFVISRSNFDSLLNSFNKLKAIF